MGVARAAEDGIGFASSILTAPPWIAGQSDTDVLTSACNTQHERRISMADTGDPGMAGRPPIDPGPEFRGRESHGAGDTHSVKVDMGQGSPPVRRPAARSGAMGGTAMVMSAVLSLLFGGAGAWAYERFLAPPRAETPPAEATPPGRDSDTQKHLARLEDRINGLSDQYKDVRSRLEAIPRPSPPPDLGPLEQKVARVDEVSQQVEAIGKKLEPLPGKLAQSEQKLAELDAKLEGLHKEMTTAGEHASTPPRRDNSVSRASTRSPRDEAEAAPSASEKGGQWEAAYDTGVGRFADKQYQQAYDVFRRLLQSQPDDARVWYYAALSYGLATRDWGRATESMVEEGVNREKAGKPPKPEVDSAFAGLTRETGKEWLDYYRRRAQ